VHNALDDVRSCLEAVEEHSSKPYRLIIVDDGSDSETREYLDRLADRIGACVIRNERARGYTCAANQGLRTATGDFVLLLNSDTIVGPDWLDRLIACAAEDPSVGLVGPLSNFATWQSVPQAIKNGEWANNELPTGFTVADMAEAIGHFSALLHPRVPFLNGFCLLIRRSVIESIGVFDEENFGAGYGEENDYCLRARAAGWNLAIADDAYVYHSGSKSYTEQKRRVLSERSNEILRGKHGANSVDSSVQFIADDRVLHGVRAHAAVAPEQETLVRLARQVYTGQRLLWVLPVMQSGGGGAVVVTKARIMREMGVDVSIFNLAEYREAFERNYPDVDVPLIYGLPEDLAQVGPQYNAVVATANETALWLLPLATQAPQTRLGYFIQDFEPYFYDTDKPGYNVAWASYSVVPNLRRFATTRWIRDEVVRNTGMDCALVGGCYNSALFRPRPRSGPEWPGRPLRVAAMIRPGSQYRAPKLTMEVLSKIAHRFGTKVEIWLFGVDASKQSFLDLPHDFRWRMAGVINQRQVANFLNDVDIFVDFSTFQALGITAQEAMSCGAAVIVPKAGGAETFARHGDNCLMVDTSSVEVCTAALTRLLTEHDLRAGLQRTGMYDVCAYHPQLPTYNILRIMFG
jgi:GT2 family glycosyltransferase